MQQLAQTLAPDERARAARFYRERDQHRFTCARGLLRTLLGGYLHCAASELQFTYGHRGKPALHAPFDQEQLCFNVSHSRGLALYAITRGREIGIDIEYMRELNDAEAIAERFFSERERAALRSLHPAQRHRGFFTCWCRKEAYIKAIGEGLAMPLDQFDVSLLPDEPARLLQVAHNAAEATRWSLVELAPATDYMGALVVEGYDWHLRCWRWSD
ncbi:MAG: 4'-phosphopantetheinyl transferase superfamily protein [Herpetosiphonaceae bacterium]|nr:4'-phosphopantetheinyl transferase superfamily protein [Herpetosiphonaceae bacterium]